MTPKEYAGVYHLAVAAEHRLGDNIANSVTHDIGAVLAITGAVVLVITSIGGTGLAETSADVFSNAGVEVRTVSPCRTAKAMTDPGVMLWFYAR